jgi:hypothetical protein
LVSLSPALIGGRRRASSSSASSSLAFLVERKEAVELHHRAGGAQFEQAAGDLGGDVDGGAFELGGFHLARDRAQPDQLIKPGLI